MDEACWDVISFPTRHRRRRHDVRKEALDYSLYDLLDTRNCHEIEAYGAPASGQATRSEARVFSTGVQLSFHQNLY